MKRLLIYLLVLISPVAAQAAVTQLNALSWCRADGTDQTVNMQKAVNAAATAGQSLFVPPGIVYTAASLTNTANVLIEDYTDLGQKILRGALEIVSPPLAATTNYFGGTNVTQKGDGDFYGRTFIDSSNVLWWGAKADDNIDDGPAFVAAMAALRNGVGRILIPEGTFDFYDTLLPTTGMEFCGVGPNEKIKDTSVSVTKLVFHLTNAPAIHLAPVAGATIDSVSFRDLIIDGENCTGTSDGVFLDGTSGGGAMVRGIDFDRCTIRNFPRNQVRMYDYAFDVLFSRVNIHNRDLVAGDNLVTCLGSAETQITFDNCWLSQVIPCYWCYFGASHDTRWIGGTVEANTGANGIFVEHVGITVIGTHFESYGTAAGNGTAIQYVGTGGGFICPSDVLFFSCGIRVGISSSPTTAAVGVTIAGSYTGNNITAGGVDVHIEDGGSRRGVTILPSGNASGATGAVVLDERATVDGVYEVNRLDRMSGFDWNAYGGFLFTGGTNWSVIYPAIRLRNGRLLTWEDSAGSLTNSAFIGLDSTNQLVFGAGNKSHIFLSASNHTSVSIGNPPQNPGSAILELSSTNKAFLPPRMTQVQRESISPAAGAVVYQTDGTAGLKYYDGVAWQSVFPNGGALSATSGLFSGVVTSTDPGTGLGSIVVASDDATGFAGSAFAKAGGGYPWQQYWQASDNSFHWLFNGTEWMTASAAGTMTIKSNLTVIGTMTLGATNTAPADPVTPTKWISVQVNGEATAYRIPLYE